MNSSKAALRYGVYSEGQNLPPWTAAVIDHVRQEGVAQLEYHFQLRDGQLQCVRLSDRRPLSPTEIGELKLDFVLSVAPRLPSPEVAAQLSPRVWYYRFGQELDGEQFGKLELFHRSIFQVIFLEEMAQDERRILRSGNFRARHHSLTYHRRALRSLSADWVAACARVLASGHALHPRHTPSLVTLEYPRFLAAHLVWNQLRAQGRLFLDRLTRQFVYRQWSVGQIQAPIAEVALQNKLDGVKWWPAPRSPLCLADPQPIRIGDKRYLMAESFSYVEQHGRIISFDLDDPNLGTAPVVQCQATQHISYPCVSVDQSTQQNYAVFEDLSMTDVLILKGGDLPNQWSAVSHVEALFPVSDPTLFQFAGRWWLFATRFTEASPGNTCLYAWYSEEGPEGTWKPHLRNPIKTDVASARGAGPVFEHQGQFYRPSQNCAQVYGESIVLNRIQELTPTEFAEVQVRELLPHADRPRGIHHISSLGDLTFFDGRKDRFSLAVGFEKSLFLANRFMRKVFHYGYFQSWRYGLWTPQDRRFMTEAILPYFQQHGHQSRILFVGVYDYTADYAEGFAQHSFVTLDWDPSVARYGAREHHIADIATFEGGPYDAVILNGVVGFGLNHQHHIRRALRNVQRMLVPGGQLVVGTTVEKFRSAGALFNEFFSPMIFPPTGQASHCFSFPLTRVQHEYRFMRALPNGTQRTPYENHPHTFTPAPDGVGVQHPTAHAGAAHGTSDR